MMLGLDEVILSQEKNKHKTRLQLLGRFFCVSLSQTGRRDDSNIRPAVLGLKIEMFVADAAERQILFFEQ